MPRHRSYRSRRRPLTKSQLLPLQTDHIRLLSLENHLAFVAVRSGNVEQISCLLRVIYLAFFVHEFTSRGTEVDLFRRAETVLDQCISRVERGEPLALKDGEHQAIERVLVLHDEQLAALPTYRYVEAWERLRRFMTGGLRSPISKP